MRSAGTAGGGDLGERWPEPLRGGGLTAETVLAMGLYGVAAAVATALLPAEMGGVWVRLGIPASLAMTWLLVRGARALPGVAIGALAVALGDAFARGADSAGALAALPTAGIEIACLGMALAAFHRLGGASRVVAATPACVAWALMALLAVPALRTVGLELFAQERMPTAGDVLGGWLILAAGGLIGPALALFVAPAREAMGSQDRPVEERDDALSDLLVGEAVLLCSFRANTALSFVNRGFEIYFGLASERLLGRRLFELVQPTDWDALHQQVIALTPSQPLARVEMRARRRDGAFGTLVWSLQGVFDESGALELIRAIGFDLADDHHCASDVRALAFSDPLTELPNRRLLDDRLMQSLGRFERDGDRFALLLLDLDRFKYVNDAFGHAAGDALLVAAAARLNGVLRQTDTLARLGGDEFVVLQADCSGDGDAAALARKILEALETPFELEGRQVRVGASIGIALVKSGEDRHRLMAQADRALYAVKERGRGFFAFDTSEIGEAVMAQVALADALEHGIDNDELFLRWQPEIDLVTGEVHALEALVRWRHPDGHVLSPDRFVPLAERYGLIQRLGAWVLEHAVEQFQRWRTQGVVVPRLEVNVSPLQLRDEHFVDEVAALIRRFELAPSTLALDLAESVLLSEERALVTCLEGLAAVGVVSAVDDFGIGDSSFAYLRRFAFGRLKIAQSLCREERNGRAIVKASVALADELGIDAVLEGVETEADLASARTLGARYAQGYLFTRPVPAADVPAMVDRCRGDGARLAPPVRGAPRSPADRIRSRGPL